MQDLTDDFELQERLAAPKEADAVLAKQVKAKHAKYETEIVRPAADIARRDTEAARRDRANLQWLAGMPIAVVILIIIGTTFLIRFGGPVPRVKTH